MSKKNPSARRPGIARVLLIIGIVVLSLVLVAALLLLWGLYNTRDGVTDPTGTTGAQVIQPGGTLPPPTVQLQQAGQTVDLGFGLQVTDTGSYTGIFVEDGSDEVVSGVLMLVVRNSGTQDIQYAELSLPTAAGEAKFTLSTLPAGQSVVLLEQSRMAWSADERYTQVTLSNVALFTQPVSLCREQLQLQGLDGVLNITNISGQDITGDIVIYYKNAASDLLYGGITYRVRISGGLKAGELRQIAASHFYARGSRVMFVTVG